MLSCVLPSSQHARHASAESGVQDAILAFNASYQLEVALSQAQREQAYAIRYQVYCEEFSCYEPKARFPDRLEHNDSDSHSVHLLVTRRSDGTPVATARLVLTDPADPTRPLPFEEGCCDTLEPWAVPERAEERLLIAEVSRYAILGSYRSLHAEHLNALEHQAQPVMALTLGLFCHAVAEVIGIRSLFGVMDNRLAEGSRSHGAQLMPVGQATEFHGMRTPFYISLAACARLFPDLYALASAAAQRAAAGLPTRSSAQM